VSERVGTTVEIRAAKKGAANLCCTTRALTISSSC